jgi:hypothetical protein
MILKQDYRVQLNTFNDSYATSAWWEGVGNKDFSERMVSLTLSIYLGRDLSSNQRLRVSYSTPAEGAETLAADFTN